jgi:hypothetical protein
MTYNVREVQAEARHVASGRSNLWKQLEAGLVYLIDQFDFKTSQDREKWKRAEAYWRQLSLQYDQQEELPECYSQLWLDCAIAILSGGNFIISSFMPNGDPLNFTIPLIGRLPRLVKTASGDRVKVLPRAHVDPPALGLLFVCRDFVECMRIFGGAELEGCTAKAPRRQS